MRKEKAESGGGRDAGGGLTGAREIGKMHIKGEGKQKAAEELMRRTRGSRKERCGGGAVRRYASLWVVGGKFGARYSVFILVFAQQPAALGCSISIRSIRVAF